MSDSKALKYVLFKIPDIETYVQSLADAHPDINSDDLLNSIFADPWDDLELKERIAHITEALYIHLPDDYDTAVDVIVAGTKAAQLEESFLPIVSCEYVCQYGLGHWDKSMWALEILTQYGTAEGAIRYFILDDSERAMAQMLAWSQHENEHVRRLASEGCRPRLPWNMALPAFKTDPSSILPILNNLKNDPSEYVRRSVANNLNDIAKDNPQVVINTLREWNQSPTPEIEWISKHGLRTLIKAGNTDALAILGYPSNPEIEIQNFSLDNVEINMGEAIELSFDIVSISSDDQNLMVDYVLHAMKANGTTSAKVWKLKKMTLAAGATEHIQKKHVFRPVTTRTYYSGTHRIELQINGTIFGGIDFELVV